MNRSPLVYIRLPRVGLGNMLYVWARGLVLARQFGVEPVVSSWTQLHPGALLRGERSTRLYWRQLRSSSFPARIAAWWRCRNIPPLGGELQTADSRRENAHGPYLISDMGAMPADDSFRDLKACRSCLRAALEKMLYPQVRREVERSPASCIGIHVRRGDFGKLDWFTPIEYFCTRLQTVRDVGGSQLPAVVFSDGSDAELSPLLQMPAVVRAPRRCDAVDLLSLGKSRLIIASGVSTFGNWASFLSDGIIIRNPRWIHQEMRPQDMNQETYEGTPEMDPARWPELLLRNVSILGSGMTNCTG